MKKDIEVLFISMTRRELECLVMDCVKVGLKLNGVANMPGRLDNIENLLLDIKHRPFSEDKKK